MPDPQQVPAVGSDVTHLMQSSIPNVGDDVTHLMAQSEASKPKDPNSVTLGDLIEDPKASIYKIGSLIGKDLSDPKLWMSAAAMYFGPKMMARVAPAVNAAARSELVSPGMVKDLATVGLGDSRVNAGLRIGQRVKGAFSSKPPSGPTAEGYTQYGHVGPVAPSAPEIDLGLAREGYMPAQEHMPQPPPAPPESATGVGGVTSEALKELPLYKVQDILGSKRPLEMPVMTRTGAPPYRAGAPSVQSMVSKIYDAATDAKSGVNLNEWESKFVASVAEQAKTGRALSPAQTDLIKRIFTDTNLTQMKTQISSGVAPHEAAQNVSAGNPSLFGELMTAYIKGRQVGGP